MVVPKVFADADAELDVVDGAEVDAWAGLEVALLVEDVVGWQQVLEMQAGDSAVAAEGGGVVQGSAGAFF